MKSRTILPILPGPAAMAARAHGGVENPAVLARMDRVRAIGEATEGLGEMAEGAGALDADAARDAARTIATDAADTPALFEARESGPRSEALRAIWETYDNFTAKASDLAGLAGVLATGIETPEALRAGLGQLGNACKACPTEYRE